ncbi:MAG: cytochrome C oxidase subunit IV family protein [Sphingomonas sp.]
MTDDTRRFVILAPLAIWAGLMVLLGLTAVYAYLPAAPIKPAISLSIGIAKALLIAMFFMQLRKSAELVRLASMVGLIWASFLFILTFADLLTR